MGEFSRRRNWTRVKLDVGVFGRGRISDVGEFRTWAKFER